MSPGKIAVTAVVLLSMLAPAAADLGPKPTNEFNIVYNVSDNISLEHGERLQCGSASCENASPVESPAFQGLRCGNGRCISVSYGYQGYSRLRLYFSDGVRESNVFTTDNNDATFRVTVNDDGLEVRETTPLAATDRFQAFLTGAIITFLIEVPVAAIFLSFVGPSRRVLGLVLAANVFSLTFFWILYGPVSELLTVSQTVMLLELFAFVSEFLIIDRFRGDSINRRQTALLSAVMNISSFLVGLPVLLFVATF